MMGSSKTTGDASRVSFIAEYYDPQAALTRTYQLFYCEADSSVEMHDLKNKRIFLKRCPLPSLTPKEVFLGATVTVYGRQLHLVEYGDERTRKLLQSAEEEAVAEIKGHRDIGSVIRACNNQGLRLGNVVYHPSDSVYVISALGTNAHAIFQKLQQEFRTFRVVENPVAQMFSIAPRPAALKNTTICVVKPHAILAGDGGAIVQRILDEGFDIVAFRSYNLGLCDAEDFFEVYKGVVPEYKKLVEHMASGPCWAIEIKAENSVQAFRAVCGPHDPEVCRTLFPNSIRAQFGVDRVKNAVHCTDLQEESSLESEFFFTLLPSAK